MVHVRLRGGVRLMTEDAPNPPPGDDSDKDNMELGPLEGPYAEMWRAVYDGTNTVCWDHSQVLPCQATGCGNGFTAEQAAIGMKILEKQQRDQRVRRGIAEELERRMIRRGADEEEAAANAREPIQRSLSAELLLDDDPVPFAVEGLLPSGGNCVFSARFKVGKAVAIQTPIVTTAGWKTMGTLQAGDFVFGSDGNPVRVDMAHPVMYGRDCYRIDLKDGRSVVADGDHLWYVWSTGEKRYLTLTTCEILTYQRYGSPDALPHSRKDRSILCVDTPGAISTPDVKLPFDPYLLGCWLGDGTTLSGAITTMDTEVVQAFIDGGYPVTSTSTASLATTYRFRGLTADLKSIGVIGDKHIPDEYLNAGTSQRRALLGGLMDSDGGVEPSATQAPCSYTSTRQCLADGVLHLARSLGYKAHIRERRAKLYGKDCGPAWVVGFTAYRQNSPFRLERHTAKLRERLSETTRSDRCAIAAVTPVPTCPVRCITVAAPDGLYLVGRGFITTHNTTLINQITRAYVDEQPFLGCFKAFPPETASRVGIFNYEMTPNQYRQWLRKSGIENTDAVELFHLRGIALPFTHEQTMNRIVGWLKDADIGLWIIDPASRAITGSMMEDKFVGPFVDAIDEIKDRAGVRDCIVVHHMGHDAGKDGEQRGMGATRWSSWPDALWMASKDEDGNRYFSADGRDVDVPKRVIDYNPETMSNTYGEYAQEQVAERRVDQDIIDVVRAQPGIAKADLRDAIGGRREHTDAAVRRLLADGVVAFHLGARNRNSYYLPDDLPTSLPTPDGQGEDV